MLSSFLLKFMNKDNFIVEQKTAMDQDPADILLICILDERVYRKKKTWVTQQNEYILKIFVYLCNTRKRKRYIHENIYIYVYVL